MPGGTGRQGPAVFDERDLPVLLRVIVDRLEAAGEASWATNVRDAEAGAATGTEARVRVGDVLEALVRTGVARRCGVEPEVRVARRCVDPRTTA